MPAAEPSLIGPLTGLSPRSFGKQVTVLRRGADVVRESRPWGLALEDQTLLVAAYWPANLTMRQLRNVRPARSGGLTRTSLVELEVDPPDVHATFHGPGDWVFTSLQLQPF